MNLRARGQRPRALRRSAAAAAAAAPDRGRPRGNRAPHQLACVRTQEKACCSDSRFRRKLSGTTDIVFWERRDRICCVR